MPGSRAGVGDPAVQLGLALSQRFERCVEAMETALSAAGLDAIGSPALQERRRQARTFASLLVVRWLITGVAPDPEEMEWLGRQGELAADEGLPIAEMTRPHLIWRDANLRLIAEISRELGTPAEVQARAAEAVRASNDASIVRMTRAYDRQLRLLADARREGVARSRFLAAMSHELRTPLNAILGFGQLLELRRDGLDEQQRRYLDHITSSGRHLLELIEEILDLTRIAAGEMRLHPEALAVGPVVEAVLAEHRAVAEAKGLALGAAGIDPALRVVADRGRLVQVLANLLSNAVKFSAAGSIEVRAEPLAGEVAIEVVDSGPGMTEADQERAFQEFVQLDAGSTRAREGSGLGLPLARRLTELMGGRLEMRSAAGSGTRVRVILPAPD